MVLFLLEPYRYNSPLSHMVSYKYCHLGGYFYTVYLFFSFTFPLFRRCLPSSLLVYLPTFFISLSLPPSVPSSTSSEIIAS